MRNSDVQEISNLLGISYEAWLPRAREVLQAPDSPLSVRDGVWKVSRRAELLMLLGSRILDQNLDAFKSTAVKVLSERDPAFELPPGERYAARIHGKVQAYSPAFRKGLAEGLALVGNNPEAFPNASQGKAEAVSILAIREILSDADWTIWGSLNNLLPNLSEAAPKEFLDSVDAALASKPCPFDQLFAQEGAGVTGGNYLTGLLWALEGLAWDPDLLVRVCVTLADLASHDPGGGWANRPANSLATILLPWLPQTLGSIEKRRVAVQTVINERSSVGWNLLLQLLPGHHQMSSGSHKPEWRKSVPHDWKAEVSREEYWIQVTAYSEMAVEMADTDPGRLITLASRLNDLPRTSFDALVSRFKSVEIANLPEGQRRDIWDALVRFALKHRKFADAEWALPSDAVEKIEETASLIAPRDPFELHQHLFSERDFDLYEENADWQEQHQKLDKKREVAVREILVAGGIREAVRFAEAVRSPRQVGYALGVLADVAIDHYLLPDYLSSSSIKSKALVDGYIWRRFNISGWEWCDSVVEPSWTLEQKADFLCQLPFFNDTWERAASWLGASERLYWSAVWANPYHSEEDLTFAINKLIEFNRPYPAIECLYKMLRDNPASVRIEQIVKALCMAVSATDATNSMDGHHLYELIQFLQEEPSVPEEDLFRIEWSYLPLLNSLGQGKPKLLEYKLANEPDFFCEVIRLIYRSKNEDEPPAKHTEDEKTIATNAWRLLHEWSTPPGTQSDSSFASGALVDWLGATKKICTETGHLDVALIQVGSVLIYAPVDPDGLWIDDTVASILNDRDHEPMRSGFSTAIYNARGVHWVDPTGTPEKELAEEYRSKAEAVENAGFQRFASMLRDVADGYEQEAKRIVSSNLAESIGED